MNLDGIEPCPLAWEGDGTRVCGCPPMITLILCALYSQPYFLYLLCRPQGQGQAPYPNPTSSAVGVPALLQPRPPCCCDPSHPPAPHPHTQEGTDSARRCPRGVAALLSSMVARQADPPLTSNPIPLFMVCFICGITRLFILSPSLTLWIMVLILSCF